MLRLILAEDSVLLRAGLTELLTRGGHHVIAAVGDADQLVRAVEAERPDVVVTDVRMPPDFRDEGLRAALELRARDASLPVLVLSQYVATAYATRLLTAGGRERAPAAWATCSRTGSARWPSSSTRSNGWPAGRPSSTPRWCASC